MVSWAGSHDNTFCAAEVFENIKIFIALNHFFFFLILLLWLAGFASRVITLKAMHENLWGLRTIKCVWNPRVCIGGGKKSMDVFKIAFARKQNREKRKCGNTNYIKYIHIYICIYYFFSSPPTAQKTLGLEWCGWFQIRTNLKKIGW